MRAATSSKGSPAGACRMLSGVSLPSRRIQVNAWNNAISSAVLVARHSGEAATSLRRRHDNARSRARGSGTTRRKLPVEARRRRLRGPTRAATTPLHRQRRPRRGARARRDVMRPGRAACRAATYHSGAPTSHRGQSRNRPVDHRPDHSQSIMRFPASPTVRMSARPRVKQGPPRGRGTPGCLPSRRIQVNASNNAIFICCCRAHSGERDVLRRRPIISCRSRKWNTGANASRRDDDASVVRLSGRDDAAQTTATTPYASPSPTSSRPRAERPPPPGAPPDTAASTEDQRPV